MQPTQGRVALGVAVRQSVRLCICPSVQCLRFFRSRKAVEKWKHSAGQEQLGEQIWGLKIKITGNENTKSFLCLSSKDYICRENWQQFVMPWKSIYRTYHRLCGYVAELGLQARLSKWGRILGCATVQTFK